MTTWQSPVMNFLDSWSFKPDGASYGAHASWMVGGIHWANDLVTEVGEVIKPIAPGKVLVSDYHSGYGNRIIILHGHHEGKMITSLYGHGQKNLVNVGDVVEQGTIIQLGGESGHTSGPHVHLEIRESTSLRDRYAGKPYNIFDLVGKPLWFAPIGGEKKYAARHLEQYYLFRDGQLYLRVVLQSIGSRPLAERMIGLFYRRDPNIMNPVNADTSILTAGKANLTLVDQMNQVYHAELLVRDPQPRVVPPGLYREDFQLAFKDSESWLDDGFNCWFSMLLA